VPVRIIPQSSVVKTILENRDKQMAAVVLGCQSESLDLIGEKYPNITLPAYIIGLICAGPIFWEIYR